MYSVIVIFFYFFLNIIDRDIKRKAKYMKLKKTSNYSSTHKHVQYIMEKVLQIKHPSTIHPSTINMLYKKMCCMSMSYVK